MGTGQKKLKEGHNRRECKLKAERNERAEAARCSHIETNSIVKKAAKQIHTKREMDHHERTWTKVNSREATSKNLRINREQWLDKLLKVRCKVWKLEKYIEKCNQKEHNIMLQQDQKGFFRTLEAVEKCKGNAQDAEICWVLGRHLNNGMFSVRCFFVGKICQISQKFSAWVLLKQEMDYLIWQGVPTLLSLIIPYITFSYLKLFTSPEVFYLVFWY